MKETSYTVVFTNGRALYVQDFRLQINDEHGDTYFFGSVEYCSPESLDSFLAALADESKDEFDWQSALEGCFTL